MKTRIWCIFLALTACNISGNDGAPEASGRPPQPDVTPPEIDLPTPDPAEIQQPACPTGFTANDANQAFATAAGLPAGSCTFEAVRARGTTLQLVWKDAKDTEHVARIHPAACTELPATGALALDASESLRSACPPVVPGLQALLDEETFPLPSVVYQPDAVGPDGDGQAPVHPSSKN